MQSEAIGTVPEAALDLGLVTMAAGAGWLASWLLNRSSRIGTWADPAVTDVPLAVMDSGWTAAGNPSGRESGPYPN